MFERKKLGILQPNLQGKLSYQGGKIVLESPISRKRKKYSDENQTPIKSARKDGIYEDPATPVMKRAKHCSSSGIDAAVQTDRTPRKPSAVGQAMANNQNIPATASTSTASFSGTLASDSVRQVVELGVEKATPIVNQKTNPKSVDLKTPKTKVIADSEKATKSGVKVDVAAVKSTVKKQQISNPQNTIDMLTSEVPGERYWEMVAAERKAALISSLEENKQLYVRNSELQDRVHDLEHENTLLEDMLKESRVMVELLESVTNEQNSPDDAEQPEALEEEDEEKLQTEPLPAE